MRRTQTSELDNRCVNTIRFLAVDAVEKARSGHPGTPMGAATMGAKVEVRCAEDGDPFRTDQANMILDCHFGPISDPQALARRLDEHAGIVEHGLFLGLATDVFVARPKGVRHLMRVQEQSFKH